MPRPRNPENRGLPNRWRYTRNAYYYQVPEGKEHLWDNKQTFRLGKTLTEASAEWARRVEASQNIKTVGELLDRYKLEIVPKKAVSTQYQNNEIYIPNIRKTFGKMRIIDVEPVHIYQYIDKRRRKTPDGKGGLSIAKREMSMFSDVYTKAVQWGLIKAHPFKGEIETDGEKPRTRYVENWELDAFLSLQPRGSRDTTLVIQAYTQLKILSGLRQQDLLSLKVTDIKEDGIHVTPLKTRNSSGKSIIIEMTPALRRAVDYALAVRPVDITPWMFCTRRGESYYHPEKKDPASGWKSIFRRYTDRVIAETELEQRFTEHDLRAKTASDLEDSQHAQKLLSHTDIRTTERIYRRKPERVKPAG